MSWNSGHQQTTKQYFGLVFSLTLTWTLVSEEGVSSGVSWSWMMERYPLVLAEW